MLFPSGLSVSLRPKEAHVIQGSPDSFETRPTESWGAQIHSKQGPRNSGEPRFIRHKAHGIRGRLDSLETSPPCNREGLVSLDTRPMEFRGFSILRHKEQPKPAFPFFKLLEISCVILITAKLIVEFHSQIISNLENIDT